MKDERFKIRRKIIRQFIGKIHRKKYRRKIIRQFNGKIHRKKNRRKIIRRTIISWKKIRRKNSSEKFVGILRKNRRKNHQKKRNRRQKLKNSKKA